MMDRHPLYSSKLLNHYIDEKIFHYIDKEKFKMAIDAVKDTLNHDYLELCGLSLIKDYWHGGRIRFRNVRDLMQWRETWKEYEDGRMKTYMRTGRMMEDYEGRNNNDQG